MLGTIREYALERLGEEVEGEGVRVRRWHAEYYLVLAESAQIEINGPKQKEWLDRLERDLGNLRATLNWAWERGEIETAARMAVALHQFWRWHGRLVEGRMWFGEALFA